MQTIISLSNTLYGTILTFFIALIIILMYGFWLIEKAIREK